MNLFLDDIRMPYEVGNYIYPIELRFIFKKERWHIVRNYKQFVEFIQSNRLPDLISFDHDLAEEHYSVYMHDMPELYDTCQEKTGFHCAQWLVKYCKDHNKPIPEIICHSMNLIGKEKILKLFTTL